MEKLPIKQIAKPIDDDGLASRGSRSATTSFGSADLLLLLTTLIWGSNYVVIKYALEDILPINFTALRFAIASIVMLALMRASGRNLKLEPGDFWKLFALGIVSNVLYQVLFMEGMKRSRAGNASLILATVPIFTALIGRLRRSEFFTPRAVIGLILAFGGLALIVSAARTGHEAGDSLVGHGLLLLGATCWATYTAATRRFVQTYGAIKATTVIMLCGTPVLLLVSMPGLIEQNWRAIRLVSWAGVLFSAFLAIALSYVIWNYGIHKIGSTRTSIYSNVTPAATLIVAWAALGEVPLPGQIAGAVIILVGVYLVRRGVTHPASESSEDEEIEEVSLVPGRG
ncbi:MAG TPA: DMT family transporter [Blastocatellia bacterium]|nr:DMT family transporter [Blastocatellia bacterium]